MSDIDQARQYILSSNETPLEFHKHRPKKRIKIEHIATELHAKFSQVVIFENYQKEESFALRSKTSARGHVSKMITDGYNQTIHEMRMRIVPNLPSLFETDVYTISFRDKKMSGGIQILNTKTKKNQKGYIYSIHNTTKEKSNIVLQMPEKEQLNLGEIEAIINFDTAEGWKQVTVGLNFLIDNDTIPDNPTYIYGFEEKTHIIVNKQNVSHSQKMTGFNSAQIESAITKASQKKQSPPQGTILYPKQNETYTFYHYNKRWDNSWAGNGLNYYLNHQKNKETNKFKNTPQKLYSTPGYSQDMHWFGLSGN